MNWWDGKTFITYNGRRFETDSGTIGNMEGSKSKCMISHAKTALKRELTASEIKYIEKVEPHCRFFGVIHHLPDGNKKLQYVG
jgi:hypothetical protein